jgi:hypothetical protein
MGECDVCENSVFRISTLKIIIFREYRRLIRDCNSINFSSSIFFHTHSKCTLVPSLHHLAPSSSPSFSSNAPYTPHNQNTNPTHNFHPSINQDNQDRWPSGLRRVTQEIKDPLRAFKARVFTYRKMRGFESPSVQFFWWWSEWNPLLSNAHL